jgi:hypothetical protein
MYVQDTLYTNMMDSRRVKPHLLNNFTSECRDGIPGGLHKVFHEMDLLNRVIKAFERIDAYRKGNALRLSVYSSAEGAACGMNDFEFGIRPKHCRSGFACINRLLAGDSELDSNEKDER